MRVESKVEGTDVEKLAAHKANPGDAHLHLVNDGGLAVVRVAGPSEHNADAVEVTVEQAEDLLAKGFKKYGWALRHVKGVKRAPNKPKLPKDAAPVDAVPVAADNDGPGAEPVVLENPNS